MIGGVHHPLLGIRTRSTVIAIGGITTLIGAGIADHLLRTSVVSDIAPPTVVVGFDVLSGAVIFAMGAVCLLGVGYGYRNGGPFLAAAVPLVPHVVLGVLLGDLRVDVDTTLSVAAAAAGAAVAFWRVERASGEESVHSLALGLVVALAVPGVWWTVSIGTTGAPHAYPGVVGAVLLLGLTVVSLVVVLGQSVGTQ